MPERLLNNTWIIRRVSPFNVPWDLTDLREIEHNATGFLRTYVDTCGRVERDGTYVAVEWISVNTHSNHLFFDVRVADQQTAQVILCCGDSKNMPITEVDSFPFCLVHGDRKTYELILSFLENTVGCVVGKRSFRPTSVQLAHILYDTIQLMDDTTSGQLDIAFGLPRHVRNLDEFSVSIPRVCFERIMVDLLFFRPKERDSIPWREDFRLHFFKAIQLFILQVTGIDIQPLPMIRVSNSFVMLEVSGKLKMLQRGGIHDVLLRVKEMVSLQAAEEHTSGLKRKRSGRRVHNEESEDLRNISGEKAKIDNDDKSKDKEEKGSLDVFIDASMNGDTSLEAGASGNIDQRQLDTFFEDELETIEVFAI